MQQEYPFATRVIGQEGFYVYIIPGTKPSNPPTFFTLGYPIGIAYHDNSDSLYVAEQVVEGRLVIFFLFISCLFLFLIFFFILFSVLGCADSIVLAL